MVWAAVGAFIAFIGFDLYNGYTSAKMVTGSMAVSYARLVETHASMTFDRTNVTLSQIIPRITPDDLRNARNLPETRRRDLETLLKTWQKQADGVVSMSLTDASGYVFANSVGTPPGSNLGDRKYFLELKNRNTDNPVVSEAVKGRVSQKYGIQVARRLPLEDGSFGGMIVANLGIEEYFDLFYSSLSFVKSGTITLLYEDNTIISRFPWANGAVGSRLPEISASEIMVKGDSEIVYEKTSAIDGRTRLFARRRLPHYPVFAIVGLDNLALTQWREKAIGYIAAALVVAVLAGIAIRMYGKTLQQAEVLKLRSVALDQAAEAFIITDDRGVIEYVNPAFTTLTGYTAADACGNTPRLLNSGHHPPEFYAEIWQCLTSGRIWRGEIINRRKDGSLFIESAAISPVTSEDGKSVRYVAVKHDVTVQKRLEDDLRALATTDPLTGIANRRTLMDKGHREIQRALRHDLTLSILLIDIDHFKLVNDRWGHAAGDRALQVFAGICSAIIRDNDTVGRMGGEEFAVILPDTDLPQAVLTAERLLSAVREANIAIDGGSSVRITASIGVATIGAGDTSLEQLLARSDAALYHAKAAGRDRVCTDRQVVTLPG